MERKNPLSVVWGVALILMGVAVFFRIPHIMARISHIGYFASLVSFVRFSFYLMSILLIGGGIKKLYAIAKPINRKKDQ